MSHAEPALVTLVHPKGGYEGCRPGDPGDSRPGCQSDAKEDGAGNEEQDDMDGVGDLGACKPVPASHELGVAGRELTLDVVDDLIEGWVRGVRGPRLPGWLTCVTGYLTQSLRGDIFVHAI